MKVLHEIRKFEINRWSLEWIHVVVKQLDSSFIVTLTNTYISILGKKCVRDCFGHELEVSRLRSPTKLSETSTKGSFWNKSLIRLKPCLLKQTSMSALTWALQTVIPIKCKKSVLNPKWGWKFHVFLRVRRSMKTAARSQFKLSSTWVHFN